MALHMALDSPAPRALIIDDLARFAWVISVHSMNCQYNLLYVSPRHAERAFLEAVSQVGYSNPFLPNSSSTNARRWGRTSSKKGRCGACRSPTQTGRAPTR